MLVEAISHVPAGSVECQHLVVVDVENRQCVRLGDVAGAKRAYWYEEVTVTSGLRLEGLTLTVANVDRSVEFYGNILGLEVAHNASPAFAMIKIGGAIGGTIGLLSVAEAASEGAEPMTRLQARGVHVEFTTDDVDALYEELLGQGMTFDQPPHDEPWERVMTGFDPDGYSVEIAQGRRGQTGDIWST